MAYAKEHGRTPAAMLEYDDERYPGGIMCGFMAWITEKKAEFMKANPDMCCTICTRGSEAFSKFLLGRK